MGPHAGEARSPEQAGLGDVEALKYGCSVPIRHRGSSPATFETIRHRSPGGRFRSRFRRLLDSPFAHRVEYTQQETFKSERLNHAKNIAGPPHEVITNRSSWWRWTAGRWNRSAPAAPLADRDEPPVLELERRVSAARWAGLAAVAELEAVSVESHGAHSPLAPIHLQQAGDTPLESARD